MTVDNSEQPSRTAAEAREPQTVAGIGLNMLVITLSILATLVVAEAGYRLASGIGLFDRTDWRERGFRSSRIGDRAVPDPVLGWTLKKQYRSEDFNTIDHGIRRNFAETEVRTGGILVSGDSFAEGFDNVGDHQTWPAYLEKTIGMPVVNGAIAGFATDQIILRAEQLLPIVRPKTLIVAFTEVDFYRASLSESGAPKPYFTIENGALVYHAPGPIDPMDKESAVGSVFRDVLGHSALGNHIFTRLAPDFWYPSESSVYQEIENHPLDVTCKLLERLKTATDKAGVRVILFLQYAGEIVLEEPFIVPDMRNVTECAQKAGIQVLDQFAPLKGLTNGKYELVAQYYSQYENGEFGHMAAKGNEHAAALLAQALQPAEPAATASPPLNAGLGTQAPLPN